MRNGVSPPMSPVAAFESRGDFRRVASGAGVVTGPGVEVSLQEALWRTARRSLNHLWRDGECRL